MKKLMVLMLSMTFVLVMVGAASALMWTEGPDAGQLVGTAQHVGGGIDRITGHAGPGADLYAIDLAPGFFMARTFPDGAPPGANFDTQLFLFDSTGLGIKHNDDWDFPNNNLVYLSRITANLAGGLYYIGISAYDIDPWSATGSIFNDDPVVVEHGPDGPGGGSPLSGWFGDNYSHGAYTITMNQSTVPEPATMLLLGSGLIGLAGFRRKFKKS